MKYGIGDKVRVISDLVEDDPRFDNIGVDDKMVKFSGKKVTITHVYEPGEYLIFEDDEEYVWAEAMFSEITEFTLDDLETRMVIETRNGDRYLVLRDQKEIHVMCSDGNYYTKLVGGNYRNHDVGMRFLGDTDLDIMMVFPKVDTFEEVKTVKGPIWERKERKKMTLTEICKELGYDVEIIQECEAENEE